MPELKVGNKVMNKSSADALLEIVEGITLPIDRPYLLAMSGPQGSGKSTALKALMQKSSLKFAALGIDDFYLTLSERKKIAKEISPLFETRGPPGTHDVNLINETIDNLINANTNTRTSIPEFQKIIDDRIPEGLWPVFTGKPDIILLEGWLVGATVPDDMLSGPPINEVEEEDINNKWRIHQAINLEGPYQQLWDRFDSFVHIEGPGFETVYQWRKQQEAGNLGMDECNLPIERLNWLRNFIQFYERITKSMATGHRRTGMVISIDDKRRVIASVSPQCR